MTKRIDHLQSAAKYAVPSETAGPSGQGPIAAIAQAHASVAIAQELSAIREAIEDLKVAVTDRDGFSSADHLRHIGDQVERIAKNG
jgi:predicted alpha/beta-hydrolase family hydrolase